MNIVKGDVRLNCAKVVGTKVGTPVFDLSRLAEAPSVDHPNGVAGLVVPDGETVKIEGGHLKAQAGVPQGIIAMWSGAVNNIPGGWALCDGTNGTPNLRDRFIVGAGSTYAPGATGGANTHTHTASAANTTAGTTIGATTLTVAQIPAHMHELSNGGKILSTGVGSAFLSSGASGTPVQYGAYVDSTGGAGSHTHTATGTAHTHTVTVATGDNLPSYYALAYIMKL